MPDTHKSGCVLNTATQAKCIFYSKYCATIKTQFLTRWTALDNYCVAVGRVDDNGISPLNILPPSLVSRM